MSLSAPDTRVHICPHSLRGNQLGDKEWSALFRALSEKNGDKIESWDLSGEKIGAEAMESLVDYISVSSTIKSLT